MSEAYEEALIWMEKSTREDDTVIILTDSRSLVSRLKCGQVKEPWTETIRNIKASYQTTYIRGYAGIWYKTADLLAGAQSPLAAFSYTPVMSETKLREIL